MLRTFKIPTLDYFPPGMMNFWHDTLIAESFLVYILYVFVTKPASYEKSVLKHRKYTWYSIKCTSENELRCVSDVEVLAS